MKNVYDEIQDFYDGCMDFDLVIEQAVVEGYLRKKAWQGLRDEELKEFWQSLRAFFHYLNFADIYTLQEISEQEYVEFALWMEENCAVFQFSEKAIVDLFQKLRDFQRFLQAKKLAYEHDLEILEAAQTAFFLEGKFIRPVLEREEEFFMESIQQQDAVSDETANKLNFLLERLLNKIGLYYKNEEFSHDFNRAISLYSGPFNSIPEEEGEEFWLGFWDYFLFDYHLSSSDLTPLAYFYESKKDGLTTDEKHILGDLLHAKFTVFYIHRIVNQYTVECIDLMTDEKIQLPIPDYGMYDYRKILLYGHVYSEGVVMLNYITSVQVSAKLRKRIKEEIVRQHVLYQRQQKDACIDAFFERHAILVRHVIDILIHLAKVNVGLPALQLQSVPAVDVPVLAKDPVAKQLEILASRYKFSCFSEKLLLKMWNDYLFVRDEAQCLNSSITVAASAVFLSFSMINGMNFIRKNQVLENTEVSEEAFNGVCDKVVDALQLQLFDSRYLTEEGFVLSLYAF